MAQNKRNIKRPPTYKISNHQFEKLKEQNERRYAREAKLAKYKVPKRTKAKMQKLLALAGAGLVLLNLTAGVVYANQIDKDNNSSENPGIEQQDNKNDNSSSDVSIGTVSNGTPIEDNGHNYLIDPNSIVISSQGEALAIDESGIIRRGTVDISKFNKIFTKTEKEMSGYSLYKVNVIEGANVRAAPSAKEDNIISAVPFNDFVLGRNTDANENNYMSIIFVTADGVIYEGYIREDLVSEVGEFDLIYDNVDATLMKVDTSKDGEIPLNLRTNPEIFYNRNVMRTIPHGSIVKFLGEKTDIDGRSWSEIEYKGSRGCVLSVYLQEYFSQKKLDSQPETVQQEEHNYEAEENDISQFLNDEGTITGIDVSSISPSNLEKVLENGIPETVPSAFGNFDAPHLAGDVNFVYMKLGASPYGNGDFEPVNYNNYINQVKVCEESDVPYGFYYYSTCKTVEEANIELEHIQQKIEGLRSKFDMEDYKLEIAIDIELNSANDRQYQGNVEEQTRAKATLINGIQERGLSDNVLIYGPMRVMRPSSDRIIDLELLHNMLSNPDNVKLWLCRLADLDGQLPDSHKKDVSFAEKCGFEVIATQSILDAKLDGRVDINTMDSEHFEEATTNAKQTVKSDSFELER